MTDNCKVKTKGIILKLIDFYFINIFFVGKEVIQHNVIFHFVTDFHLLSLPLFPLPLVLGRRKRFGKSVTQGNYNLY